MVDDYWVIVSYRKICVFGSIFLLNIALLSGCGSKAMDKSSDSQVFTELKESLTETDLFELKVSLQDVTEWGLAGAEKDEFFIKSYSDAARPEQDFEIVSVVPEYCMPLANLILDSKASGADLFSYQSFTSDGVFSYFGVGMRVFASPELAKSKFAEMQEIIDKCGSFIPKYISGETESEWTLWSKPPTSASNSFSWENKEIEQAWSVNLVGSVIYEISVVIENNLEKSIGIRDKAKTYFDQIIESKQL